MHRCFMVYIFSSLPCDKHKWDNERTKNIEQGFSEKVGPTKNQTKKYVTRKTANAG